MMRKNKNRDMGGAPMTEVQIPEWVKGMHAYRNANGYFRASDVLRVLGDQSKSVEVPVVRELAAAASIKPENT
jgi:hypothetical protein